MTKKKEFPQLSAHQRQQKAKKAVKEATAFTPEEVRQAIEVQPRCAMAMTVAVNLNYERFVDVFVEKMAALVTNQTKEQLVEYRERIRTVWNNGIHKEAAVYWYTLGATYHDEIVNSVIHPVDEKEETNEGKVGQ